LSRSSPLQIHSLATGKLVAFNRAHVRWLGYAPADLPDMATWFERVYPDATVRAQIQGHWELSLQSAADTGSVQQSPELQLRANDGSLRDATGTMTIVGDDVIVAWTDLTDIRRSERALRASEQHFRTMIEQTVMGVYVQRNGKFVYVNPRFCAMIGRSAEQLLGQDVLSVATVEPETQPPETQLPGRAWWDEFDTADQGTRTGLVVIDANGQRRELKLHASAGRWENKRASIVVAEVVVGKNVLVIGGGNTAIDAVDQAKRLGAQTATMAYRRGHDPLGRWK